MVVRGLDRSAGLAHSEAAVRLASVIWRHIESEKTNDPAKIMATVSPTAAPLAYCIPMPKPSGTGFTLPVGVTHADAQAHYEMLRDEVHYHHLDYEPVVEIRSDWYAFFDGVTTFREPDGNEGQMNAIVFFPMVDEEGIGGEMAFSAPPFTPGIQPKAADQPFAEGMPAITRSRAENRSLHASYVAGLAAGDVDGVLAAMGADVQGAVRDYAPDTPTFLSIDGRDAMRDYYQRFFARYRPRRVDLVQFVTDHWYVFSELLWEAAPADGGGTVRFRTAEMAPIGADGLIAARIGYGTDPEPR